MQKYSCTRTHTHAYTHFITFLSAAHRTTKRGKMYFGSRFQRIILVYRHREEVLMEGACGKGVSHYSNWSTENRREPGTEQWVFKGWPLMTFSQTDPTSKRLPPLPRIMSAAEDRAIWDGSDSNHDPYKSLLVSLIFRLSLRFFSCFASQCGDCQPCGWLLSPWDMSAQVEIS